MTLEDVKNFLRIEHEEEDMFLSSLLIASQSYIQNSTRQDADPNGQLFRLVQLFLVQHWYHNRDLAGPSQLLPYHIESLLLQITSGSDTTEVPSPIETPSETPPEPSEGDTI